MNLSTSNFYNRRILFIWFFILMIFSFINHKEAVPVYLSHKSINSDSVSVLKLSFVGDLMCHAPQYESVWVSGDSYDFRPNYRYVKEFLSDADFTFGNLETVTAGKLKQYSGYPLFNTPSGYIDALYDAGFDFLFTSNNHSLDRGKYGVEKTIENLDRNNLGHTGTFISQRDRDSIRIISKNGFNLAVLAYTYSVNGNYIPKGCSYLVNFIDTNLTKIDIKKARSIGADIILVYYHFGDEYSRVKSKYQTDVIEKTIRYGADIIIGSHPHVMQSAGFMNSKYSKLDSVFVASSLGNFISCQRERYKDSGVILNLELVKDLKKDSIYIGEMSFIPTWVFKGYTGKKNEFLILPARTAAYDSTLLFLTVQNRKKAEQSFLDTKKILTNTCPKLKVL